MFDDQIEQEQKTLDQNRGILAIYESQYANGLVPQTEVRIVGEAA